MTDIIENVTEHITEVKDFFIGFISFFTDSINMIPSPFKEIILAFLPIAIIIIALNIWGDLK